MSAAQEQHSVLIPRRVSALVDFLAEYGVSAETVGQGRVVATEGDRCLIVCLRYGWWEREHPTTGDPVMDRLYPRGMEYATARRVANLLAAGGGTRV